MLVLPVLDQQFRQKRKHSRVAVNEACAERAKSEFLFWCMFISEKKSRTKKEEGSLWVCHWFVSFFVIAETCTCRMSCGACIVISPDIYLLFFSVHHILFLETLLPMAFYCYKYTWTASLFLFLFFTHDLPHFTDTVSRLSFPIRCISLLANSDCCPFHLTMTGKTLPIVWT